MSSTQDRSAGSTPSGTPGVDPLLAETSAAARTASAESGLPERLGEFRIVAVLGRGGMGTVYLAEQQHPAREVALKVLRGAQDDPDALRRFRLEGEALALLEHPNIAHVYATGIDTQAGSNTPYLAMELVRGRSLLADADARGLATEARLRLMLEVCRGVQHAHQRGVIHRDLKPANILVDADGRPKIMDFGIARIVRDGADVATRLTEAGQVVGTILYMSPEQLRGETAKIDVRSDVFALGVILYELLSGRRPRELDASSLFSAIKSAERTPIVPLARVAPRFGGDLDTIVMKALAEERAQRYASVGELAADIERHLEQRPIEARAPSALYVAGKFARRNRVLVTAAAIAVLALVASTVFALWSAQREREARALAESKTAVADAVNDFTRNMLRGASVFQNQGRAVAVGDLLNDAERALDRDLATQPIAAGEVALLLADAHKSLGQYARAATLAERAANALPATGEHLEMHAQALLMHAAALISSDRIDAARALLAGKFAAIEPGLAVDSPSRLDAVRVRASVVERDGHPEQARTMLQDALAAAPATASQIALRAIRQNLALLLRDLGEAGGARALLQTLLDESLATGDPIQVQEDQNNLGTFADRMGELDQAHALLEQALAGSEKVFGRDHPATLATQLNLLNVIIKQGRFEAADAMSSQLLTRLDENIGRASYLGQSALNTRAYLMDELKRDVEAETLYRDVLQMLDENPALRGQESVGHRNNLAMLLLRLGRYDEAVAEFRRGMTEAVALVGPDHPYTAIYRNNLGEALTGLGHHDEALRELRASHPRLVEIFGAEHERVKKSLARIAAAERGRRPGD